MLNLELHFRMKLELPKPSCYCKKTAYDWEMCRRCQYCYDCEYNCYGYNEAELDYFLLYY